MPLRRASLPSSPTTTIPDSYTPSASGVRTAATRAAALAPAASTSSDGEFYTLAGSIAYGPGGASNYFGVDDNINVYVNDALVATSGVSGAGYKGPYTFQASYGDTLRLEAVDTYGGCHGIGPTTLYQGSESQVLIYEASDLCWLSGWRDLLQQKLQDSHRHPASDKRP